jgi:enoyl-CoA hydratase/carnithine racemase
MSVDVEVAAHVATITINRPERMNAMDGATYEALSQAWERVRDDREIRVAVVTGAGDRAFSAGGHRGSAAPRRRSAPTDTTPGPAAAVRRAGRDDDVHGS